MWSSHLHKLSPVDLADRSQHHNTTKHNVSKAAMTCALGVFNGWLLAACIIWASSDVRETAIQFCWQPFCICLFSAPNSWTTQGSCSRREPRSVRSCQKDQNIWLKLYCNHDDRVNASRRVAVYTEWSPAVSLPTRGVSLTTKLCTGCRQAWNTLRAVAQTWS